MKPTFLTALLLLSIGVAACDEKPKQLVDAPSDVGAPAPAIVPVPTVAPVDNLRRNAVADAVPFQAESARVDGNELISTGAPGFMMYGPYVSFAPGEYLVTVKGRIPKLQSGAEVRFDVASNAGNSIHGEHVVKTTSPKSGTVAEFRVTIPADVSDLEVRAQVTEGAEVRIESYDVIRQR